ncbi:MAG TPA: hypothetical protein VG733_07600, partial [Chthoniobacteraceae bacterium]|nr:hypothetical protein [Chthoniobacteraceae bacterium]
MQKTFAAVAVALITIALFPAEIFSQTPQPSPAAKSTPAPAVASPSPTPDYSSMPPAKIIDKLQQQIINWQDDIINGIQAEIILGNLYRAIATGAVDTDNGKVKDQKLLDLLSKYGISVGTKGGAKLNTPATTLSFPIDAPELVPMIEVKSGASREEKARIVQLLEKEHELVDRANGYKKIMSNLQYLAVDLLELGKTDDAAQGIIDKAGLKLHVPSPSPSPSP